MYLVPDVHLGEVLHHVDDVLGPGHGEAPGDEVILHVDHQQRPSGREDALEPVYGLAPVLQLLQQMLNLILKCVSIDPMSVRGAGAAPAAEVAAAGGAAAASAAPARAKAVDGAAASQAAARRPCLQSSGLCNSGRAAATSSIPT